MESERVPYGRDAKGPLRPVLRGEPRSGQPLEPVGKRLTRKQFVFRSLSEPRGGRQPRELLGRMTGLGDLRARSGHLGWRPLD